MSKTIYRSLQVGFTTLTACFILADVPIAVAQESSVRSAATVAKTQLRIDLEKAAATAFKLPPADGNKLADEVLAKYIPPGTPFQKADEILRNAGLTTSKIQYGIRTPETPEFKSYNLSKVHVSGGFVQFYTHLLVHVYMKTPGEYDVVEKSTGIFTSK